MTNNQISNLLRQVAYAFVIINEAKYRFQILAYHKAADAIENTTVDLKYLFNENRLDDIPGVGASIKAHLGELLSKGHVKHFDSILKDIPKSVFPLLNIPGFGPKKSYKLVTYFKLDNPDTVITDLENKAKNGQISPVEGFGVKSEKDILDAITAFRKGLTKTARMSLPYAHDLADKLITYLQASKDVLEVQPLGSLRRKKETIGDIDLAVSTNNPSSVIEYFINYPYKERILEQGDTTAGLLVSQGKHIDLMTMPPDRFGSLLQHFTGSKEHNVHLREYALKKGFSLSEYGIKKLKNIKVVQKSALSAEGETKKFDNEKSFYNYLGMQWIPPELREDTGEIELAVVNKLPELIKPDDIKGDFHLHSNFPIEPSHDMGVSSMEEMVHKAVSFGYNYIGFAEHNPSISKHTAEQIESLLKKKYKKIDQLNSKYTNVIRIYSLLETDILPDGSLAINDRQINHLDFMLVSIHSVFSMDKDTMTNRILEGLSHPKAKILTHPSGRLINSRIGYEVDWEKLFIFCLANNKAIEINAYPSRLDLTDVLVRKAVSKGVKLVINTDSHSVDQMELMKYGISVARRGWAEKHDILNTWEYNKIEKWIRQ